MKNQNTEDSIRPVLICLAVAVIVSVVAILLFPPSYKRVSTDGGVHGETDSSETVVVVKVPSLAPESAGVVDVGVPQVETTEQQLNLLGFSLTNTVRISVKQ